MGATQTPQRALDTSDLPGARYIGQWNWGAAFFTPWWLMTHRRVRLGIIYIIVSLIPYVNILTLGCLIYFGRNGNRIAVLSGRFTDEAQFVAVQNAWRNWAFGMCGVIVCFFAAAFVYNTYSIPSSENHSSSALAQVTTASPAAQSKADEVAQGKKGPTAVMLAGNALKWQGAIVSFPCKIRNVIEGPAANAICGRGVTVNFTQSNVDYSDPNAADKALKEQNRELSVAQDQAMLLLVGDKVGDFDGGQVVLITGTVVGNTEGKNTMGATVEFPTVHVDFGE